MVLCDECLDRARHSVFLGEINTVADVGTNYRCTCSRLQFVVRVSTTRLILHEVLRLAELANVVVIRPNPPEQSVGTDCVTRGLSKVRHRNRVRIGTRRLQTEPPQERLVEIRPRKPAKMVGDPAPTLRTIQK